jgi:hypothetical protein
VGQDIDSRFLFRQLRDSQLYITCTRCLCPNSHARGITFLQRSKLGNRRKPFAYWIFCRKGGGPEELRGGGVTMRSFLRKPLSRVPHPHRHRDIPSGHTLRPALQEIPLWKEVVAVPIGFAGEKKNGFSSSPFAVLLLCRLPLPPMI